MSQCPKCGASVDHDFGVTSCAKCAAVLFVDFDGQVQMADPAGGEAQEPPQSENIETLNEPPDSELQAPAAEPLAWENPIEEEDLSESVLAEEAIENDPPSEVESFGATEEVDPPAVSEPPAPLTNLDFSDVLEFANRAELDNTPLLYTLWIEGIDHREIRRKVESVLSEPRLNFHLKELLPSIRGGILELRDLNPAKTNFIANRLRGEAVRFRWRQSVFGSESESEPGAEDLSLSETGTES